jgi:HlyD family secretion protein
LPPPSSPRDCRSSADRRPQLNDLFADVLKVPIGSLCRRGDAWTVFVARDDRAESRTASIEHRTDRDAEVTAGLQEGDAVILHPSDALTAGSRIAPRE